MKGSWRLPITIGLAGGAIAIASYARPAAPSPRSSPVARVASAPSADVAGLRHEVARLRADVAGRDREVAPPPVAAATAPQPAVLVADQVNMLEELLDGGDRDPSWSADAARSIHAHFPQAALAGATLEGATCRGAVCKVELRFDSPLALDRGAGDAADAIPWTSSGFVRSDPDDPLRLVLYASREGTRLPRPDQR